MNIIRCERSEQQIQNPANKSGASFENIWSQAGLGIFSRIFKGLPSACL